MAASAPTVGAPAPSSSLRTTAVSGVRWTAGASVAQIVLSTVQFAILGRLLSPRDCGPMAMVATIVDFAAVFAGAGLSATVLHKRHTPTKVPLPPGYGNVLV